MTLGEGTAEAIFLKIIKEEESPVGFSTLLNKEIMFHRLSGIDTGSITDYLHN